MSFLSTNGWLGWVVFIVSLEVGFFHIYAFFLESIWWQTPKAFKAFRTNADTAKTSATLAANQGIYNLLLSVGVLYSWVFDNTDLLMFVFIYVACVGIFGYATVGSKVILNAQAMPGLIGAYLLIGIQYPFADLLGHGTQVTGLVVASLALGLYVKNMIATQDSHEADRSYKPVVQEY